MGANREVRVRTRRSRGLRLVVLAAVCLIAGFVVQTLVAFGIMKYGPTSERVRAASHPRRPRALIRRDDLVFHVQVYWHRGVHVVDVLPSQFSQFDLPLLRGDAPSWVMLPPNASYILWTVTGVGWPLTSWTGIRSCRPGEALEAPTPSWFGQRLGLARHGLSTVDLNPANTLANSAFYGVFVAGFWLIASTARRGWRSRFRPGTCPHCGYALAGLPAAALCPECGKGPATAR